MGEPLVSIIVPVYNVEKYLENCIDSIKRQTFSNYEVILVDDGSNDSSSMICDECVKKDSRFRVIHKDNAGLGYARNSGLNIATGKYIVFIDSDDFIEETRLEKMMKLLQDTNADTCISGYSIYKSECNIQNKVNCYSNLKFEGDAIKKKLLPSILGENRNGKDYVGMAVWRGVFSREIIENNNIRFVSERELVSEDVVFDIEYYKYAKKVVVSEDTGYFYRVNEMSLTHSFDNKKYLQYEKLFLYLRDKLLEYDNAAECIERCERTFLVNILSWMTGIVKTENKESCCKIIGEALQLDTLQNVANDYTKKIVPLRWFVFLLLIRYKKDRLLRLVLNRR